MPAHAGHVLLPLSPLLPNPGHHAIALHLTLLDHLAQATVEEELDTGQTSSRPWRPACRSCRAWRATDAPWTRAAPPPRARPGPSLDTLSTAVTPRRPQTRAQPRPVTAGAGDDDLFPYAPRPSWKQCDPTKPPPTALSPPNASPGPVEHRHDHA
jgi:hypothetical protein